MIKLIRKDNEVDIELEFIHQIGSKPKVNITATGDLTHHLIEGLFQIVERLSKMENCCHRAEEYK